MDDKRTCPTCGRDYLFVQRCKAMAVYMHEVNQLGLVYPLLLACPATMSPGCMQCMINGSARDVANLVMRFIPGVHGGGQSELTQRMQQSIFGYVIGTGPVHERTSFRAPPPRMPAARRRVKPAPKPRPPVVPVAAQRHVDAQPPPPPPMDAVSLKPPVPERKLKRPVKRRARPKSQQS